MDFGTFIHGAILFLLVVCLVLLGAQLWEDISTIAPMRKKISQLYQRTDDCHNQTISQQNEIASLKYEVGLQKVEIAKLHIKIDELLALNLQRTPSEHNKESL